MSNQRPWMKFYPTDWRGDQALRVVSLGARGLWIECMCIMHEATPYGHLIINGRAVTDAQLAALAGTTPDQIAALLNELETAGVFSRNRNGAIYSRRMTRDEKKRKDGEKTQKNGTLPTSRRGRQVSEKTGRKSPPPEVVVGVVDQPPSTQKPEAREELTIEAGASMGTAGAAPAKTTAGDDQSDEPDETAPRKPAEQQPTEQELVWGEGLDWIAAASGRAKSSLRSMVGRWCRDYGAADVLTVIASCRTQSPPIPAPVPWIEAALKHRKQANDRNRPPQRAAQRNGWLQLANEKLGSPTADQAGGSAGWDGASFDLEPAFVGVH